MRRLRGKITKVFKRNFFSGVGAAIMATLLFPVLGGHLFIGWNAGEHEPVGERIFNGSLEASSSPPTDLADYDWTVQSLDGQDFKMAHTRGKVVFLNFWATWCSPCVAEMASIQRLYEKLKDKGVVFACISNEDGSKVSRFLKKKGYTFPIYTIRGSPPAVFNTQRVPTTFILSRDGRIALKHIGSANWNDDKSINLMKGLMK